MSQRLLAPLDQRQVWRRFAQAGEAPFDPLAREVDQRMQARLEYISLKPSRVLDLGSGAGESLAGLGERFPEALLLALDAAPSRLPEVSKVSFWQKVLPLLHPGTPSLALAADARSLPLRTASCDLVWSNFLLPWVDDYSAVFAESHRVLRDEGLFMFSTLGPDTLKELAACFRDSHAHVHTFPDMHDVGDLLGQSGFADPVVDMETIKVAYSSLERLLLDLRGACATNAHTLRPRSLMGRKAWAAVRQHWQDMADSEGRVTVTFEVVYGHAWRIPPKKLTDGRSVIRFERPVR